MPYPFVQCLPDSWRISQTEIGFPPQNVDPQLFDHLLETASAATASQYPNPLLERCCSLVGHTALDLAAGGHPKAIAEELTLKRAGDCALGSIHRELQSAIESQQQGHHSFPCAARAQI